MSPGSLSVSSSRTIFITSSTAFVGPLMRRLFAPKTGVTLTRFAIAAPTRLVSAALMASARFSARPFFKCTVWITLWPLVSVSSSFFTTSLIFSNVFVEASTTSVRSSASALTTSRSAGSVLATCFA